MSTSPAPPPDDLRPAGRAFWSALVTDYDLNAAELLSLATLCRVLDTCRDLEAVVAEQGLLREDGRPVPALVELRQQRLLASRLLASLPIPADLDAAAPGYRPNAPRGPRGPYRAAS